MKEVVKFLKELKIMIVEEGTEWPSRWKDIPKKCQKDFKSWVNTYKQQDWGVEHVGEDQWHIAWNNYHLQYVAFIIDKEISEW